VHLGGVSPVDSIDLPLILPGTTVSDAVGVIIAARQAEDDWPGRWPVASVVTIRGERPVILTLQSLGRAAEENPATPVDEVAADFTAVFLASAERGGLRRPDDPLGVELDREGVRFGVATTPFAMRHADGRVGPVSAHVITRSEIDGHQLRSALRACRCNGPEKHVSISGELVNGGECNKCTATVSCR